MSRVREVAALFPELGPVGFGGPAAPIAVMADEVVRRRRWPTREQFLDLLGTATRIAPRRPGP
jgi:chromate transporter